MKKDEEKKYNPKVTFDGSFEDLLGLTFNTPKSKYKVGDMVMKTGDDKKYVIVGNKENGKVPYGSDYSIQLKDGEGMLFVKEEEIHIYA